jgi:hypothetical protein
MNSDKTIGQMSMDTVTAKAIINFAYFTANFPPDFIAECWSGEEILINHLKSKLRSSDGQVISMGDFMRFFLDLDRTNQIKLANWIDNNYEGVTHPAQPITDSLFYHKIIIKQLLETYIIDIDENGTPNKSIAEIMLLIDNAKQLIKS